MRLVAWTGILAATLMMGTGCQGAPLPAATSTAATSTAAPTSVAARTPDASPQGFALFLEREGGAGSVVLLDKDAAMDTILASGKRPMTPRRSEEWVDSCTGRDRLDALASERGVSRAHARHLDKIKTYAKPDAAK